MFWKNDTHVFVTWEPPHKINGPLHSWTLSIEETDKELKELELAPEINNSTIELRCFGPEWNVTPVIRLRANVQQLSGEDTLNGIWKEAPVPPCLTKGLIL